jgi:2-iminobutanoate/2-iminopropanoate deaminase
MKFTQTDKAPAAVGPYSQAVEAGGFLFASGQIPLNPETGEMVAGGIREQTGQVLKNLEAVLQAAGVTWSQVVKVTIYLTDMSAFAEVNELYAQAMGDHRPARATVEVSALPKGALVEMDAIVYTGGQDGR